MAGNLFSASSRIFRNSSRERLSRRKSTPTQHIDDQDYEGYDK
jgi:hypothetical protein